MPDNDGGSKNAVLKNVYINCHQKLFACACTCKSVIFIYFFATRKALMIEARRLQATVGVRL